MITTCLFSTSVMRWLGSSRNAAETCSEDQAFCVEHQSAGWRLGAMAPHFASWVTPSREGRLFTAQQHQGLHNGVWAGIEQVGKSTMYISLLSPSIPSISIFRKHVSTPLENYTHQSQLLAMSSYGFYAFGSAYGSNSQMLDCASTPHMHYYSDDLFHFKQWLHLDSLSAKSSPSKSSSRRSSLFSLHRKGSHKQVNVHNPIAMSASG